MATHQSIFIWERCIYYKVEGKGWVRDNLARLDDATAIVQEHVKKGSKLNVMYDPDVLQTEFTECPGGGRPIVREALIGSHETIANIHTAWGFQHPWNLAGSNGSYGTFCSYETVASLYPLVTTLREAEYTVGRAVPFTALATHGAGAGVGRTTIFLVVDKDSQAYVYLHTATGVRAARKLYAGKRQEAYDVWSEISMVFGEYGVSFEDGGQRPQMHIYQAPGTDIKTQCPYWDVLAQQTQCAVHTFDALALLLDVIPAKHPCSLMDDMPKFINFDFGLKIAAAALAVICIGIGIYAYIDLNKGSSQIAALSKKQSELTAQNAQFERNKREIEALRKLYSQDIFEYSRGRLKMIQLLSSAIPKEATVISLATGDAMDASFRISGIFWDMVGRKKPVATTRAQAGKNTTPVTSITRTLESGATGLLVTPSPNQYNAQTGDFFIEGTTPRPETPQGAKPAATRPPAPMRPGQPPAKQPKK